MTQSPPDPVTPTEPALEQVVPLLRSLGLTATEAEIYLAALQTCSAEPFSSYKLAQAMGRDPANVGKVLGALVRRQAMTVVQEKPRLYLAADPTEFTERTLAQLQRQGRQAVDLLRRVQAPRPAATIRRLTDPSAAYAQARRLLTACRRTVLVFGSKEPLRELGAELEERAAAGCSVNVLSPLEMGTDHVRIAVYAAASVPASLRKQDFLQLVVDEDAWLSAVFPETAPGQPCGWWSADSPIAGIMAGALILAWPPAVADAAAAAAPTAAATLEPAAAERPSEPFAAAKESDDEDAEEMTFLMRHEERKSQEKGEL